MLFGTQPDSGSDSIADGLSDGGSDGRTHSIADAEVRWSIRRHARSGNVQHVKMHVLVHPLYRRRRGAMVSLQHVETHLNE